METNKIDIGCRMRWEMESSPLPPMQVGGLAMLWEDVQAWVLEILPVENRV